MSTITEKRQAVYIGPERRSGKDRRHCPHTAPPMGPEDRSGSDRRQQPTVGIVAGLSAEDMVALREVWELTEQ